MCVRSTKCACFAEQDICNACLALNNDKGLRNNIARPTSTSENRKFVLKYYLKTNAFVNHLQHTDVRDLHQLLTDESKGLDSNSDCSFWQILANKANQGVFDKKPVFKGLCQIILQVSEASEANKGK